VRYHGVFGARSTWRALVTPKPPDRVARKKKRKAYGDAPEAAEPKATATAAPAASMPGRIPPQADADDVVPAIPAAATRAPTAPPVATAAHAMPMAEPAAVPGAPPLRAMAVASDDATRITVDAA
jgi:hypothetical protein